MELTQREIKRKIIQKRMNTLQNKMEGNNLIWWNALSNAAKLSLSHEYHSHMISLSVTKKKFKLKHFLQIFKKRYNPRIDKLRTSKIESLLK